jgi:hypothetical protein
MVLTQGSRCVGEGGGGERSDEDGSIENVVIIEGSVFHFPGPVQASEGVFGRFSDVYFFIFLFFERSHWHQRAAKVSFFSLLLQKRPVLYCNTIREQDEETPRCNSALDLSENRRFLYRSAINTTTWSCFLASF